MEIKCPFDGRAYPLEKWERHLRNTHKLSARQIDNLIPENYMMDDARQARTREN
jgi:hypothetical protein